MNAAASHKARSSAPVGERNSSTTPFGTCATPATRGLRGPRLAKARRRFWTSSIALAMDTLGAAVRGGVEMVKSPSLGRDGDWAPSECDEEQSTEISPPRGVTGACCIVASLDASNALSGGGGRWGSPGACAGILSEAKNAFNCDTAHFGTCARSSTTSVAHSSTSRARRSRETCTSPNAKSLLPSAANPTCRTSGQCGGVREPEFPWCSLTCFSISSPQSSWISPPRA